MFHLYPLLLVQRAYCYNKQHTPWSLIYWALHQLIQWDFPFGGESGILGWTLKSLLYWVFQPSLSLRAKKKGHHLSHELNFVIGIENFVYYLLWHWIWEHFWWKYAQSNWVALTKSLTTLGSESEILGGKVLLTALE